MPSHQAQSQVIKRYTLPVSNGPHDFLMGRIIRIAPYGHHCDQSPTDKLWVWTLEPPRPQRRILNCYRDGEEIPPNALYIGTVVIPFDFPRSQQINESIYNSASNVLVQHVFELTDNPSYHTAGFAHDVGANTPAGNIISQIIDDHKNFAGV